MSLNIRNIAIIAHVDHGKTTLVDKIMRQCKLFKEHEIPGELLLDNNDLERERGITILAKNISVQYQGYKINIIDTPGHHDFGGEVERVLNMADGVILLVDAFEGCMPQTRFVLQKAIDLNLKIIVVINKVDKPNCRPDIVQEEVFELMFNLDATEEQLAFPTIYGSAKEGWMSDDYKIRNDNFIPLLEAIIKHIPEPKVEVGTAQMLLTSLDYSSYVGRIAVGRVYRGDFKENMRVALIKRDSSVKIYNIKELYVFDGLGKRKVKTVSAGDICAIVGIEGFDIGDTLCDAQNIEALPTIDIDEPTISMTFAINNSPFFGKEGKLVTSRQIKERLEKELEKNLAMRLKYTDSSDRFIVFGRGILHLSILIETMRREGYELQVGQPQVIVKHEDGNKLEPYEILQISLPEEVSGRIIEVVAKRKGEMLSMERKGDRINLEFEIPSRGIIGLNSIILTQTAGEAIMAHRFLAFKPWKGDIEKRINGSLIAMESGKAIAYAIDKLQDRGTFFIDPMEEIYAGQVIGENTRQDDLIINVTKTKKLTNMRASGTDDKTQLSPAVKFSLEEALEYIQHDEYVELTPKSIRLRKIFLDEHDRKRAKNPK
ncbi:MAG: translational GTPase TypA [Salinivirgaceae bacterium]|nr:translational GTPase TypA [Salinivirgaceae bacterium]MDD4746044.1 translational GTPase TypA [Salinivirgaceae bacterium]MDY0279316.1 translational GTPase TypA [Salinivirgaceae bacterium]